MKSGKIAEERAMLYLHKKGYEIFQTNWKTPACEIDIVATKKRRQKWYRAPVTEVFFVEVKYRKTGTFGKPLEYITKKKLAHMERAANIWTHQHEWAGPVHISAIGVTGSSYEISDFIEDILL